MNVSQLRQLTRWIISRILLRTPRTVWADLFEIVILWRDSIDSPHFSFGRRCVAALICSKLNYEWSRVTRLSAKSNSALCSDIASMSRNLYTRSMLIIFQIIGYNMAFFLAGTANGAMEQSNLENIQWNTRGT